MAKSNRSQSGAARTERLGQLVRAGLVAVLLLAAAAVWYYRTRPPSTDAVRRQYETVGRMIAAETVKLLAQDGKVVVVRADEPLSLSYLRGMRAGLGNARVTLVDFPRKPPPFWSPVGEGGQDPVPFGIVAMADALKAHPDAAALAVFVSTSVPASSAAELKMPEQLEQFFRRNGRVVLYEMAAMGPAARACPFWNQVVAGQAVVVTEGASPPKPAKEAGRSPSAPQQAAERLVVVDASGARTYRNLLGLTPEP